MQPTLRRLALCLLLTPILAYIELIILRVVLALIFWSSEGLGNFTSPAQVWNETPELVVILFVISLAQLASLLLPLPIEASKGTPAPIIGRAILAGFVVTAAIVIPIVALLDLPIWLTPEGEAVVGHGKELVHAVIATWAVTWLGFAALLTHRGTQEPDRLERAVRQATTGTAIGLALATPWYLVLRRKQQCVCALGTFYALVLGIWSLIVVAGPFLLLARRDRRR
jgi:hypothetical protein